MKANELRLGNFISGENYPAMIVDSIRRNEVELKLEAAQADNWCFDVEDLRPIPLNEEWLLRFGLLYEISTFWKMKVNHKKAKNLSQSLKFENGILSGSIGVFWVEFKFVHEFQNLIFALTGQKLTLNPTTTESVNTAI